MRERGHLDNSGEFIKHLIKTSKVYGYAFSDRWFDIGSHEQLREARDYFEQR